MENAHDLLKYEAVQVGPAWEADKMAIYAELKACCLDSDRWPWIKGFETHKYGRVYVNRTRQRNRINRGRRGVGCDSGGRGRDGGGRHVVEAVVAEQAGGDDGDRGGCCGAQNVVRFEGSGY